MERVFYLGGVAAASILAVIPADNLIGWAWLLIAAEAAVCVLLRNPSHSRPSPVPVPAKARRPIRRAAPPSTWR